MGTLEFFFILCLFLARLFVFSLCQVYLVSWFRFTVSSHHVSWHFCGSSQFFFGLLSRRYLKDKYYRLFCFFVYPIGIEWLQPLLSPPPVTIIAAVDYSWVSVITSDFGVQSWATTIVQFEEKHVLRNAVTNCAHQLEIHFWVLFQMLQQWNPT